MGKAIFWFIEDELATVQKFNLEFALSEVEASLLAINK
jgi:hypothetical protein